MAYAAGLALLFMNSRSNRAVGALAPLGQMAVTANLLQTVFGIWLFYGFAPGPHLMGKVGPAWIRARLGGGLRGSSRTRAGLDAALPLRARGMAMANPELREVSDCGLL